MTTIEDKVVGMKFDNGTFEQKIGETIKSLEKLTQTLDLAGASKGMQNVADQARRVDLGPVGSAVEGISNKFLALSTVAIATLATITTHAVQAGGRILKSLSLDPVIDGFREYETNMNSIQTILANTKADGSTLEDVNSALDKLNTYSDQTIYNFSEMARNIGTFTAAGVGLEQSVNSIKGIANLAAISGSNSQQASTAMYQLSQALAAGKVNLMDWNSVVNAGMGGEVFKKALFETGKAMKTITDVPLGASFEEWEEKGGTFREQMQKGWLTADVLSTTLEAFSGDLDEAALKSMGFSEEAAREMVELGELGQAAATEIKTFTQLMSTVKESVASGWSQTFRTIFGDFEEAKALFTEVGNAIGGIVSRSADARNELLGGWKMFGGRDLLLEGFRNAFEALGAVIKPIKEAFRDIFPRTTSKELIEMTQAFVRFTEKLKIGGETATKIKEVFRGVFSVFEIGWEIIKNTASLIVDLLGGFSSAGSGALDFAANTGQLLHQLNSVLVSGGGIKDFFQKLRDVIKDPIKYLGQLKDRVVEFLESFSGAEAVEKVTDRLGDRFGFLATIADKVSQAWKKMSGIFDAVKDVLDEVWNHLSTWFGELGSRLAETFTAGDFDAAVDVVNVGLLGGIAVMIKKFFNTIKELDFGAGGLIENAKEALGGLTGTLKQMQMDLRAKALMKIAAAVGILTISVVALSMIDSGKLAKALTALSVGFGQLIGAMALMEKLSLGTGAAKLTVLAGGMILLAGAAVVLSIAVKNLSSLGWQELAKGLLGVVVMLGALVKATELITTDTDGLIKAGIAMMGIGIALYILSKAVASFGELSWTELAKGLIGVGVGLGILVLAVNNMPTTSLVSAGVGIIGIAIGMRILAEAVEAFGEMSWTEMGKGLLGVAVGLGAIVLITNTMPVGGMVAIGAGLILVSIALNIMAKAVQSMGGIPFGEMAKGIGGFAAMLVVLALAMAVMTGTAAGAVAMVVAAGALLVIAEALKEIGKLSIAQIATGLVTLAIALALIGAAAILLGPLAPALAAFGGALLLVGGAFALFGVGAMLVAKSFEIMAKAGKAGLGVLIESIKMLIAALPGLVLAFIKSLADTVTELVKAAPLLLKAITVLLSQILDTVIELVPKIVEALGVIIVGFLELVKESAPRLIEIGFIIMTNLMQGIKDNIYQIVTMGVEILVNLIAGIVNSMPMLVEAAVNLITSFALELANHAMELVAAGLTLLTSLINGITQNLYMVTNAVTQLITTFIFQVGASMGQIIEYGVKMLVWLLSGIGDNLSKVIEAVADLVTTFITDLGSRAGDIIDAGFKVLTDLLQGIGDNLVEVVTTVGKVVTKFVTAVADEAQEFIDAGFDALTDFLKGIEDNVSDAIDTGVEVVVKFMEGISKNALELADAAFKLLTDFLNGLADVIDRRAPELRAAGRRIAGAIADGITGGWASRVGGVVSNIAGAGGKLVGGLAGALGIGSPSKEFAKLSGFMVDGLIVGLKAREQDAVYETERIGHNITERFKEIISSIPDSLTDMDELNPVISPVLDLTKVKAEAQGLSGLIDIPTISPTVSFDRARQIATTDELTRTAEPDDAGPSAPTEIKFEQHNYSPQALSTGDIYRNTKSQLALAKEELNI